MKQGLTPARCLQPRFRPDLDTERLARWSCHLTQEMEMTMTRNPDRLRILLAPFEDGEPAELPEYVGLPTVLTGLPRTIRRHELRMIVPLSDTTIYDMEVRGEFPRRFISRRGAWCGISARLRLGSGTAVLTATPGASGRRPRLTSGCAKRVRSKRAELTSRQCYRALKAR